MVRLSAARKDGLIGGVLFALRDKRFTYKLERPKQCVSLDHPDKPCDDNGGGLLFAVFQFLKLPFFCPLKIPPIVITRFIRVTQFFDITPCH